MIDVAFQWTREPPREWQAALARVARRNTLEVHWVPGDHTSPVHRWMVSEMVPASRAPDRDARFMRALETASGEDVGALDEEWTWKLALWRERRVIPYYTWVAQGTPLGHPYQYTAAEAALAPEARPPMPGTLPYVEFEPALVVPALAARRLLDGRHVDPRREQGARVEAADRVRRREHVTRIDATIPDAITDAAPALKAGALTSRVDPEHLPAWHRASADEHEARFIETGSVLTAP